jgi:hypothetical protein
VGITSLSARDGQHMRGGDGAMEAAVMAGEEGRGIVGGGGGVSGRGHGAVTAGAAGGVGGGAAGGGQLQGKRQARERRG